MIQTPIIFILLISFAVLLQVITLIVIKSRLSSIEALIKTNNLEIKQIKNINTLERPNLEGLSQPRRSLNSDENVKKAKYDLNDEDILFIKEIKLDRKSKVIDMDLQLNKKNE